MSFYLAELEEADLTWPANPELVVKAQALDATRQAFLGQVLRVPAFVRALGSVFDPAGKSPNTSKQFISRNHTKNSRDDYRADRLHLRALCYWLAQAKETEQATGTALKSVPIIEARLKTAYESLFLKRDSHKKFVQMASHNHCLLKDEDGEARRALSGMKAAQEKLVAQEKAFMGFFFKLPMRIARQFMHTENKVEDLTQWGNLGLWDAVDMWNPRQGVPFVGYAARSIRNYIRKEARINGSFFKLSNTAVEKLSLYFETEKRLHVCGQDKPPLQDVCKESGLDPEQIQEILSMRDGPISVDMPVGEKESETLGDFLLVCRRPGPEARTGRNELKNHIRKLVETLGPREKAIMEERLMNGATLRDLGVKLGVSYERVRQIETNLVRRLRKHKVLKEYDDRSLRLEDIFPSVTISRPAPKP